MKDFLNIFKATCKMSWSAGILPVNYSVFTGRMPVFRFLLIASFSISFACAERKPNFIVIFTDDQGYQDLACFGSPKIKTPRIDNMAKEGMRFTDFYSANAVCSPSRASLLTGRYSARHKVTFVFYPNANNGLTPDEITIAEVLKPAGYKSAIIGKWHLGSKKEFLPLAQGFDYYFGIPFSNDMWLGKKIPFAKDAKLFDGVTMAMIEDGSIFKRKNKEKKEKIPLMINNEIVEFPVDQTYLTERYTDEAIKWIIENKENPFFIYLAYAMPHVPLFASAKFKGKSERGAYGDSVEEIDYSVGRLLDELKKQGLDKNTLVLFTSDNGPWGLSGGRGGSALPLRGKKFSTHEGGHRVPTVAWWPGKIPAGVVNPEVASTIDLLPTFAALSGAKLLEDRIIDGHNITSLMLQENTSKTPHKIFCYWRGKKLEAIRMGHWKVRTKWEHKKVDGKRVAFAKPVELYNLMDDISEKNNLAGKMQGKVKEMKAIMLQLEKEQLADKVPK